MKAFAVMICSMGTPPESMSPALVRVLTARFFADLKLIRRRCIPLLQAHLWCSLSFCARWQGERIADLKMIIERTVEAATLFDYDGISVRFMNSPVEGNNIRSSAEANNMLAQVKTSPVFADTPFRLCCFMSFSGLLPLVICYSCCLIVVYMIVVYITRCSN